MRETYFIFSILFTRDVYCAYNLRGTFNYVEVQLHDFQLWISSREFCVLLCISNIFTNSTMYLVIMIFNTFSSS